MPSSLIIVALVVAWLLVLVPIVARKRQEVARTADSTLAARVVRVGGVRATVEEEFTMSDAQPADTQRDQHGRAAADLNADLDAEFDAEFDEESIEDVEFDDPRRVTATAGADYSADEDYTEDEDAEDELADEYDDAEYSDEYQDEYDDGEHDTARRAPYRPGRGGFDPEAAAIAARAKYAFRQRIVLCIIVVAIATAVLAAIVTSVFWWAHGLVDLGLVGYLSYLRRQVRIEEEIRQRRTARLGAAAAEPAPQQYEEPVAETAAQPAQPAAVAARPAVRPRPQPGTVVVEGDDDDPVFDELDRPDVLPYRRAAGE